MVPAGQEGADYREPPVGDRDPDPDRDPDRDPDADGEEPGQGPEPAPEIRSARVTLAQHSERLDKALVALAPEFSRSHLQGLLEAGHVQLDGVVASMSSRRVRAGQTLRLELVPTEESRAFRPQAMALDILFEDEHLLVVNKPAGLVVHPAPGNWSGTLLNGLLAHHAGAATLPRAGIVHRLDKDTSGVMMVGKTLPAVTALSRDIAARVVHRRYLALAQGAVAEADFTVLAPIGRDPAVRVRMAVLAGGRAARTDVHRVAVHGSISALSCTLHTGRTHQIRVHMAWQGHPLVADSLYGGKPQLGLQRQALHATELRFAHPVSRAPLAFDCVPPADFLSPDILPSIFAPVSFFMKRPVFGSRGGSVRPFLSFISAMPFFTKRPLASRTGPAFFASLVSAAPFLTKRPLASRACPIFFSILPLPASFASAGLPPCANALVVKPHSTSASIILRNIVVPPQK